MAIDIENRNKTVLEIVNGTLAAIKTVVPLDYGLGRHSLLEHSLHMQFGVLIGFTGDVKGKLVLSGDASFFGSISEKICGMTLKGEMLSSFAGELGNMIAGRMATNLAVDGVRTDITSPTVMQGQTTLSGFEKAIQVPISFIDLGEMDIYLVLDN